jgi:hypothetical protein
MRDICACHRSSFDHPSGQTTHSIPTPPPDPKHTRPQADTTPGSSSRLDTSISRVHVDAPSTSNTPPHTPSPSPPPRLRRGAGPGGRPSRASGPAGLVVGGSTVAGAHTRTEGRPGTARPPSLSRLSLADPARGRLGTKADRPASRDIRLGLAYGTDPARPGRESGPGQGRRRATRRTRP